MIEKKVLSPKKGGSGISNKCPKWEMQVDTAWGEALNFLPSTSFGIFLRTCQVHENWGISAWPLSSLHHWFPQDHGEHNKHSFSNHLIQTLLVLMSHMLFGYQQQARYQMLVTPNSVPLVISLSSRPSFQLPPYTPYTGCQT